MEVEMTESEIQTERRHIIETRLGILGLLPTDKPTPAQAKIANDEADEWEDDYRMKAWSKRQNHDQTS